MIPVRVVASRMLDPEQGAAALIGAPTGTLVGWLGSLDALPAPGSALEFGKHDLLPFEPGCTENEALHLLAAWPSWRVTEAASIEVGSRVLVVWHAVTSRQGRGPVAMAGCHDRAVPTCPRLGAGAMGCGDPRARAHRAAGRCHEGLSHPRHGGGGRDVRGGAGPGSLSGRPSPRTTCRVAGSVLVDALGAVGVDAYGSRTASTAFSPKPRSGTMKPPSAGPRHRPPLRRGLLARAASCLACALAPARPLPDAVRDAVSRRALAEGVYRLPRGSRLQPACRGRLGSPLVTQRFSRLLRREYVDVLHRHLFRTGTLRLVDVGEGASSRRCRQGWNCFGTEVSPHALDHGRSRGWTVSALIPGAARSRGPPSMSSR